MYLMKNVKYYLIGWKQWKDADYQGPLRPYLHPYSIRFARFDQWLIIIPSFFFFFDKIRGTSINFVKSRDLKGWP